MCLCVQWEIAEVPNDSPKTTKRGKTNHPKAVSPQKMSERHAASVQNPSVSSRSGTISTTVSTFRIASADIYLCFIVWCTGSLFCRSLKS